MRSRSSTIPDSVVWTPLTAPALEELAALKPRHLAFMHGSSFAGDGGGALLELKEAYREVLCGDDFSAG